jgi:hypothetical protein
MARKIKVTSVTQSNDASCINNGRGMARRAKRQSMKTDRQDLKKDLKESIDCTLEGIREKKNVIKCDSTWD